MRSLVMEVLRALRDSPMGPGDLASRLSIPRYKALALAHLLEELGLVEKIYERGTYKIYTLSTIGGEVLRLGEEGIELREVMEAGVRALARVSQESEDMGKEETLKTAEAQT